MTFQAFKDYSIYIPQCTVQYFIKFQTTFLLLELHHIACIKCMILLDNVTRRFTRVYLKSSAYMTTCFFDSDTFYSQRLLSLKNNGKVHLHLIIQYEKRDFFYPIRENIGRSRGTNKGRSLDHFIRCRIIASMQLCLLPSGGDILFLPCPSVRLSVCHTSFPLNNLSTF